MNVSTRPEELASARALSSMEATEPKGQTVPVIVIGGGPAGVRVAQELARNGRDVIVFNAERWAPYNRVKLTPLLSGEVQVGQVTQPLNFDGDGNVALYSNHSIVDIDRERKTVTSSYGRTWHYDKLVLCMGSRPYVPPIEGADLPGVYTFRNFDDVEKLVARSFSARRCAVVGGGLLGLEAARGMVDRGVETTVIEHEMHLMARQLDTLAGEYLARTVISMGIDVISGAQVERFGGATRLEYIDVKGHGRLDFDAAILCTGIRANIELAREVGLAVGRGIKVNDKLQTGDDDIYAVGECAEFDDNVYGLVGPCFEQAVVAAADILGRPASYAGSVPATKLKIVGTDVFSMGDVDQIEQRADLDSIVFEGPSRDDCRRIVLRRGRLIGAIAIGDWPELNRVQEAIKDKALIYPWQRWRFARTGLLWRQGEPKCVRDWPRSATVCNCTGVSRGQIGDCIALGATTLADVKRDTGASTVCGTCKIHISELLDAPAVREPVKAWTTIAAISGIACVLALLTFLLPAWPTADVIAARGLADTLFLDGFTKQVSGYTLLALSVLAALLSLRKRVKWLGLGDFDGWRIFHLAVGLVAIAALFVHTGFRLGSNLNMWLMLTFLGVAVAGTAAGLATAFEHRLFASAQTAAKTRSWSFWGHLIAFWPLPLLMAMHVFSVYFY